MNDLYKHTGFYHEKLIVIPKSVIEQSKVNPIVASLYVSDIGYFPQAKNHYRSREEGSENHILICCVSGEGIVEINNNKYTLKEKCYCIIPANTPHKYFADKVRAWSIYWIHFNGNISSSFMDWATHKTFINIMNQLQYSRFIKNFNQVYSILEKGFSLDRMMISTSMLGSLLSNISFNSIDEDSVEVEPNKIEECIDLMLSNIRGQLDLVNLSKELNISKSHLIHIFKEQTGFTPIKYFIHLKIQKACNLLDISQLSIKEIADYLGYDDQLYFCRVFKNIMGSPPSIYRKNNKG